MSAPAVLLATCKLRDGADEAFASWLVRHNESVAAFPGYLSSDLVPPTGPGHDEWTLLLNFQTSHLLAAWQHSPARAALIGELLPLLKGGNLGEIMRIDSVAEHPVTNVTQVIFTQLKLGCEAPYRAWSIRMQKAQACYPGYLGMFLQPPSAGSTHWTTLLRYDTQEHLDAWLAAPERAALLREAQPFIAGEELMHLATSFPGWVPLRDSGGQSPPGWKLALLVLLGLFPIVMIEIRYLSPVFDGWRLNASFAMFLSNVTSVTLTSFLTIPLAVRAFRWWLFPRKDALVFNTIAGLIVLLILYTLEVGLLWRFLP